MPWGLKQTPVSELAILDSVLSEFPEVGGLVPPELAVRIQRRADGEALEIAKKYITDILNKGVPTTPIALSEIEFYEKYRQRLEVKLNQKVTQIARDKHLLATLTIAEKSTIESILVKTGFKDKETLYSKLLPVINMALKDGQ